MAQKILIYYASEQTNYALNIWARNSGFDLSSSWGGRPIRDGDYFDFHVTILASQNDVPDVDVDQMSDSIMVEGEQFMVIGRSNEFPCIKLRRSWELEKIWSTKVQEGWVPTFPFSLPHISLSYNWHGHPRLNDLKIPEFPLVLNRKVIKDFQTGEPASLKEWYIMNEQTSVVVVFIKVDGHWRKSDVLTDARLVADVRASLAIQGTPSVALEIPSEMVRGLDDPSKADDAVRSRRWREITSIDLKRRRAA